MIEKILYSHEYEEYIEERVEDVMSNLTYIGRPRSYDFSKPNEETDSNYFKEAMTKLIENMLNKGDLSIELRMRAIE